MPTVLLVLAAVTCAATVLLLLDLVLGGGRLPYLSDQPEPASGPRVSVIIAARDEATTIEAALTSVLAQRYTNYEVIAVEDRSTDATGAILDRVAREAPRLRVLHIADLPVGWLGKNHALHQGATIATGEILLFTDADVVFHPTVLGRTVTAMERGRLDHLTTAPELDSPTLPLALVVNFFALWFCLVFRPWRASQSTSSRYMGVGAFNAVRTGVYLAIGGHTRIAMRPDDDMKLGKLVKQSGGRQQLVVAGTGLLRIRWYATLPEPVRGLQKNAVLRVRLPADRAGRVERPRAVGRQRVAIRGTRRDDWSHPGPEPRDVDSSHDDVRADREGRVAAGPWLAVLYPVAGVILAYIVASATVRTVVRGGIVWRGTFYPLDALRRNVL